MTSGARASTPDDPKHGDIVTVGGREAVFLYQRGKSATVRFKPGGRAQVVPLAKIRRSAT